MIEINPFVCCEPESFPSILHPLSLSSSPGILWAVLTPLGFPLESARTLDRDES